MKNHSKIAGFLCALMLSVLALPLTAASIDATVWCSNGMAIANLPIQVYDNLGVPVADVAITNDQGMFTIANSETYTQPFSMYYKAKNGNVCGPEPVYVDSGAGTVYLNYYPKNLPCSCSQFVE